MTRIKRVPIPEIEQIPIQKDKTIVKPIIIDDGTRSYAPRTKEEKKRRQESDELAQEILAEAAAKYSGRASGRYNTDLPLQGEHPELWLIPAAAEVKAAGLVPGMTRFAVGSIAANELGKESADLGQKIDERLGTRFFGPTFGFVGGLGGYALGSSFTGNMLSRIPRRYSYGPVNERTYWAEDQTPKYNSNQITGHFGRTKYYGPTMGKTTAVKTNPNLIDFDDIIREPSRNILDRFGFKSKAEMYNSGNQEAIKAYEDMLVKQLRDWRANPSNENLTLVASPTAVANPKLTGFYFDNVPSIPSRDVFIARNVARGGTPEASALWYDSLIQRNPDLKIDDRFVSQIEYQAPQTTIKSVFPQIAYTADFSGVENLDAANFGYEGARPNFGLRKLFTERRSRQLLDSVAEEEKRNAAALKYMGSNWKDLSPTNQYWLGVNYGDKWNDKLIIPRNEVSLPIKPKKLISNVGLSDGVSVDDDVVKIAQSISKPGVFSPTAQYGLDKSREIFTSPWMRNRLKNMGYSNLWIDNYIQARLNQMDPSKLSIADDLNNVHELTLFKSGKVNIGNADPITIGYVHNGLNIFPINQAIVQSTKRGDLTDILRHEIAGHVTEHPGFELDKDGNNIYEGVKLTDNGKQAIVDKKLDDDYYIGEDEQRARYLTVAQQMYDSGFDPNSETDFYNFLEFHKNDSEDTNVGQLAKYYDWKSMWPAFSRAKSLIPIVGVGLSSAAISKEKKDGIIKNPLYK